MRFSNARRQYGSALIVSLLMLMLLTIMAVSAVNMTTLGLKITSNMQDMQLAESAVQTVIDDGLSESPPNWIRDAETRQVARNGYTVLVDSPVCLGAITAPGYEERYMEEINRFDNAWRIDARVSSSQTTRGESVEISQGVILKAELTKCVGE